MKVFKKLSMLFVAAAMMMTTVSTAFAAGKLEDAGTGTLTIYGDDTSYTAYRVLDSQNKFINSGKTEEIFNVNSDFKNFFEKSETYAFSSDKGISIDGKLIENGDGVNTKQNKESQYAQRDDMKALTTDLITYINFSKIEGTTFEGKKEKTLTQGYYLVVENAKTVTQDADTKRTPSQAMLIKISSDKGGFNGETINRIVNPKDAEIKIEKTVNKDVAGIGDILNYEIKSTIPTYAANYTNIKYNISDKLSEGLTYTGNLKIEVAGKTIYEENKATADGTNYFLEGYPKEDADNGTLEIHFNYETLKAAALAGEGVTVTYTATINEKASVGSDVNKNDANLEYSNQPNGETTAVKTHTETHSYGINIKKVDGNNEETVLDGAEFTVNKVENDGSEHKVAVMDTFNDNLYSLKGLGEGVYTIEETQAPNGYSKLDGKITIKITPNENDKSKAVIEVVDANGDIASLIGEMSNGSFTLEIKNYKGINLPETGGMGTTIFMVGGAALIALAGVMLVVYSKKSKKA